MLPFSDLPSANILWTLDLIATLLSFFGSLWIIFCCLKAPSPKSLSLKIIAAIGCADFFYSIANLLSNFEKNILFIEDPKDFNLCVLEAILRQASYVLSILFSTCAAVASYYSVCPTRRFHKTVFFCIVIALGFIIPAVYIIVLPQFFEGSIVTAQGPFYCWLTYSTNPRLSTFTKVSLTMTFQGSPVVVGLIITLIAYALAIKKLREIPKDLLEAYNINVYRVLWYPGILFLTFVPTVVDTVLRVFFVQRPVWINALHLLLTHSNGFNNALLYGIQTNLYHTNYEEFDTNSGGLDDGGDGSYTSMTFSENTRKSSISDTLKEAYST